MRLRSTGSLPGAYPDYNESLGTTAQPCRRRAFKGEHWPWRPMAPSTLGAASSGSKGRSGWDDHQRRRLWATWEPNALAVAADGSVYVARSSGHGEIDQIQPDGVLSQVAGQVPPIPLPLASERRTARPLLARALLQTVSRSMARVCSTILPPWFREPSDALLRWMVFSRPWSDRNGVASR